jgi:hypothetical protein
MIHYRCKDHAYDTDSLNVTASSIPIDARWRMPISVSLEAAHPELIRVEFAAERGLRFILSTNVTEQWKRDEAVHSMVCTADLFCFAKHVFPDMVGTCLFWKGEAPDGAGLCYTGTTQSHLCIPDPVFLETDGYASYREWAEKNWVPWTTRHSRLFWRGASTGIREWVFARSWREMPRFAMCLHAQKARRPELVDIGLSNIVQIHDATELREISEAGVVKGRVPWESFMAYRWAVDIDGNSCAWPSMFTKLLTQNTVVKIDSKVGFRQWYYDRLIPWRNYVPVSWNLKEFDDTVDWLANNPAEAEEIAARGRDLALGVTTETARVEVAQTIHRYLAKGPSAQPPIIGVQTRSSPLPPPDPPIELGADPANSISAAVGDMPRSYIRIGEDFTLRNELSAKVRMAFAASLTDARILPARVAGVPGMTGFRSRALIHQVLQGMENVRYLEIGAWLGGSLSAAVNAGAVEAVALDDWSWGENLREVCDANVTACRHPDAAHRLIDGDFRTMPFSGLGKFQVYFFDGPCAPGDYDVALRRPMEALDDSFIFMANNWNWRHVRDSLRTAFVANRLRVGLAIEIRSTPDDSHPDWCREQSEWHNGFFASVLHKDGGGG